MFHLNYYNSSLKCIQACRHTNMYANPAVCRRTKKWEAHLWDDRRQVYLGDCFVLLFTQSSHAHCHAIAQLTTLVQHSLQLASCPGLQLLTNMNLVFAGFLMFSVDLYICLQPVLLASLDANNAADAVLSITSCWTLHSGGFDCEEDAARAHDVMAMKCRGTEEHHKL